LYKSGNTGCRIAAVRGKSIIISTGQRATFGLTPPLSRPHRKDGGIFDSGRGKLMMFSPPRLAVTGFEGDESVRGS